MKGKLIVSALALGTGIPAQAQDGGPSEKFGAFTLRILTDPMTDATRGILVSETEDIRMVFKCDNNGPGSLYVSFISKRYLGGARYKMRAVKYRIDSAPPEEISAYHDGSTATILDLKPASNGGRWLGRLLSASKLTVQVSNFNYDTYTQVIDLNGFRPGLVRAASVCRDANWYTAGG